MSLEGKLNFCKATQRQQQEALQLIKKSCLLFVYHSSVFHPFIPWFPCIGLPVGLVGTPLRCRLALILPERTSNALSSKRPSEDGIQAFVKLRPLHLGPRWTNCHYMAQMFCRHWPRRFLEMSDGLIYWQEMFCSLDIIHCMANCEEQDITIISTQGTSQLSLSASRNHASLGKLGHSSDITCKGWMIIQHSNASYSVADQTHCQHGG